MARFLTARGQLRLPGLAIVAILAGPACSSSPETGTPVEDLPRPASVPEVSAVDWLARAADAEQRRAWEEAAYALDRWLLGNQPGADWYERRAIAAERSNELETAVRMRQELLRLRPGDTLAVVDLADNLQRAGRGREGVALLEPLAAIPEKQLHALRALATIHERDGNLIGAAEAYEGLAEIPEAGDRRVLLQDAAALREEAGDVAGALADLEAALEGVDLAAEEQRMLSRLKAFESGEPQSVADAVALMNLHPNAEFRLRGARYLTFGRFPDDSLVFARSLNDPDQRVARVAARELGLRDNGEFASALLPVLQRPEEEVRLTAIRALSLIGGRNEVPALLEMLDPGNRAQFRAARSAIEEITGHSIGVELDPDAARRAEIAEAWRAWWAARQPGGGS